jgi:triosephosphate isomerase
MSTRTPLIAGNWKMYKTGPEAVETAKRLVELVADTADVDIMIAPVFTALDPVSRVIADSRVALGAQNLYWEKEGAYTGEISADMLVAAGCRYVIIGHSERRQYFGETDETVNKKNPGGDRRRADPGFLRGRNRGGAGSRPDIFCA